MAGIQVNSGSERLGGVDHCLIFDMVRYNLAGHPRDVKDIRTVAWSPMCEVFFFFSCWYLRLEYDIFANNVCHYVGLTPSENIMTPSR